MDLKKTFVFFKDCISLNSPQAIIFVIVFISLLLIIIPTNNISALPTKCVFKNYIIPIIFNNNCPENGIFKDCSCPACGLTRAFSEFFKGNLNRAIEYNVLFIPILLILVFLIISNSYKIIKNKRKKNCG